jgi:hypothetical protein
MSQSKNEQINALMWSRSKKKQMMASHVLGFTSWSRYIRGDATWVTPLMVMLNMINAIILIYYSHRKSYINSLLYASFCFLHSEIPKAFD